MGTGWLPHFSFFHHLATWWASRDLPNVHFVHYNDLLSDLEGEMRGIATYLGIEMPEADWPELVEGATFASMKREAERYAPPGTELFRGGPQSFIYKGTNRRWRGVFSDDELRLYDEVVADRLKPGCARWLREGRRALEA